MRINLILDSLSRAGGGVVASERRLHRTLAGHSDTEVRVFGLRDAYTDADVPDWAPLQAAAYPVQGPPAFGYSSPMLRGLLDSKADIGYCAGLWKYPSLAGLIWSRRTGTPYIVAPHGMLDPWAIKNSRWKKRVARWLFQDEHLKKASCLRALCEGEARAFKAAGLTNPICIVPIGVDLPAREKWGTGGIPGPLQIFKAQGKKVLLYLGRLHPKKGLVNLINAWAASSGKVGQSWVLALAGWDQVGHLAELTRLADELEIVWSAPRSPQSDTFIRSSVTPASEIPAQPSLKAGHPHPASLVALSPSPNETNPSLVFLGSPTEQDKAACYLDCDAFILPSFSEGLPAVVLEAWSNGKPVLMTPQCNLPEGCHAGAAIQINPETASIRAGLQSLFEMSELELSEMGRRGACLVSERFVWPKAASSLHAVYHWMAGGANKPSNVI